MTEELPKPQNVPTISRMLLGGLVTTSLFFGAVGGLAVLFIGDTLFESKPDPAIDLVAVNSDITRTQQRLDTLEKKMEETPQSTNADNNAQVEAELESLRQNIATLKTAETQNTIAPALLGLTQVTTAVSHDLSPDDGIKTLKAALPQPEIQAILTELATLAQNGIPSYAEMEKSLLALKPAQTAPTDQTWEERGKNLLGQFVRIRPSTAIGYQEQLGTAERALHSRDLPIVRATLVQFPSSPALQALSQQIETRMRVENLVRDLTLTVTKVLGGV
jgi:predicted transcriptional regulator